MSTCVYLSRPPDASHRCQPSQGLLRYHLVSAGTNLPHSSGSGSSKAFVTAVSRGHVHRAQLPFALPKATWYEPGAFISLPIFTEIEPLSLDSKFAHSFPAATEFEAPLPSTAFGARIASAVMPHRSFSLVGHPAASLARLGDAFGAELQHPSQQSHLARSHPVPRSGPQDTMRRSCIADYPSAHQVIIGGLAWVVATLACQCS
ncbi:hypothetical protein NM688_g9148 [Phlebia brevispora]|uniref:Uncharacterized protein n=1 Tax=Phlebia brevispora TaxID=194682 RepID=A0ACC1RJJ7_9APHY|nr:hypothetical protein NM688_g9148 [Phlebia brevispora]